MYQYVCHLFNSSSTCSCISQGSVLDALEIVNVGRAEVSFGKKIGSGHMIIDTDNKYQKKYLEKAYNCFP